MAPYGWPLKPFDRMHPVRGYFNDPRISASGRSHAFHFGIDISANDGTAVYAVEEGVAHLGKGERSVSVVARGGRTFGYWHVVPAVRHRTRVRKHQLLGHIEKPWGHVHFAESYRRVYRNPLRPGALRPWVDPTTPRIVAIRFYRGKRELSPLDVSGDVDVVVEAWDRPPLPVPPPWNDMPVTPALVRWRVLRGARTVRPWRAPVDFRRAKLPDSLFHVVYAPGTRQNKPPKPGRYCFYVAHGWTTGLLPNGLYRLQAQVADAQGNTGTGSLPFTISNRATRRPPA